MDSLKNRLNLLIVNAYMALKLCKSVGEFSACYHQLPKSNKNPHDGNIYLNGSFASKNPREHGNTLFSEGIRKVSASTFSL